MDFLERLEFQFLKARKHVRMIIDRIDYFFEEKLDLEIIPSRVRYLLVFLFATSPVWVFMHLVWLEKEEERAAVANKIRE